MDWASWTNFFAPRLPDLSPLDFFLWGHVKTLVYSTKPQSIDDLQVRITRVIRDITASHLQNVFSEFQNRITACIHNDGGHIEN